MVSDAKAVLGSLAPKPMSMIDNYLIIRMVGRGGRGNVYLARDTSLGRKVALKVINPTSIGNDEAVQRFLFEARVTARFSHPNIVTVYGVGEYEGSPYVALEYLEGLTLRQRFIQAPLGVKESLRIGVAIAEALQEAHKNGVLHRDLKPENVMLPPDGRVRVVDFGLAKSVPNSRERSPLLGDGMGGEHPTATGEDLHTSVGGLAGTPMYMAPEQWMERECTEATDVWALGLVLYEMLVGSRAYDEPTVFALCARVCSKDPIPPVDGPAIPGELKALVAKCTEKEPAMRADTGEIIKVLRGLLYTSRKVSKGEESPFRGLLPFTEQNAGLFFGRDSEIRAFIERLRTQPVMPVIGPSGAGKSSFVQAGVIPRLREQDDWVVLSLRPGHRPFQALASSLLGGDPVVMNADKPTDGPAAPLSSTAFEGMGEVELGNLIREFPSRLSLYLNRIANEADAPVLLFVDQLEEIYGLVEDVDERQNFLKAITGAADDPKGRVRTVITLRDDFLVRLSHAHGARLAMGHITVLTTPVAKSLREIIAGPLRFTGYRFDDPALIEEMVGAVKGELASLPLIQFVCSQLWEKRERNKKIIPRAVYEELGGVEGALARHADQGLDRMMASQVNLARQILLRLVTPEGTRRSLSMDKLLEGLPGGAPAVVDALVEERILTIRRTRGQDESDVELELVHESLIRDWAQLADWISESREEIIFLNEVTHAADLWARRGRIRDEVWQGAALQEAIIRSQRLATVPEEARRFLAAGLARQTARVREKRLLVLAVILVLAVVILWFSGREQDAQTTLRETENKLFRTEESLNNARRDLQSNMARIRVLEEKLAQPASAGTVTSDPTAPGEP